MPRRRLAVHKNPRHGVTGRRLSGGWLSIDGDVGQPPRWDRGGLAGGAAPGSGNTVTMADQLPAVLAAFMPGGYR